MTEIQAIRVILLGGSRQACGEKKAPHSFRPLQAREGRIAGDSECLTSSKPEAQVSDRLTKEDHNIIINSVIE